MQFSTALRFTAVSAALLLAACESKPPATADNTPPGPGPVATSSNVVPGSEEDLRVNVGDTVHFAYDRYDIQAEDQAMLQRQAAWLQKYSSVRVTIEGDCDERGTREYNLALGARRANAVKQALVSNGVPAARIETISYGKEHPICTESSEDCWAQNRRGVTSVSGGASS
jgi:peptidoglycan-associated lipoprotein